MLQKLLGVGEEKKNSKIEREIYQRSTIKSILESQRMM